MAIKKVDECMGCIGFSEEHTCQGYADFLAMLDAKQSCQQCLAKDKRIAELEAKLKIDGDHPFPDDFTALDICVERNKALLARVAELENALLTYGEHYATCSKWDKMDSGQLFVRSDWSCDCGLEQALKGEGDDN